MKNLNNVNKREKLKIAKHKLVQDLSVGKYNYRTATYELVDNLIDADATVGAVFLLTDGKKGDPVKKFIVADNGRGLDAEQMKKALVLHGDNSGAKSRNGQFGVGLKAAGGYLGEKLVLLSRKNAKIEIARFDFKEFQKQGEQDNELEYDGPTQFDSKALQAQRNEYEKFFNEIDREFAKKGVKLSTVILVDDVKEGSFPTAKAAVSSLRQEKNSLRQTYQNFINKGTELYVGSGDRFSLKNDSVESYDPLKRCGAGADFFESPITLKHHKNANAIMRIRKMPKITDKNGVTKYETSNSGLRVLNHLGREITIKHDQFGADGGDRNGSWRTHLRSEIQPLTEEDFNKIFEPNNSRTDLVPVDAEKLKDGLKDTQWFHKQKEWMLERKNESDIADQKKKNDDIKNGNKAFIKSNGLRATFTQIGDMEFFENLEDLREGTAFKTNKQISRVVPGSTPGKYVVEYNSLNATLDNVKKNHNLSAMRTYSVMAAYCAEKEKPEHLAFLKQIFQAMCK